MRIIVRGQVIVEGGILLGIGWHNTPRIALPPGNHAMLAGLWIQRPVHMLGIARNERQIGPRRLIRFRPALLPIPQRPKRDVIAGGKFLLRQFQGAANDLSPAAFASSA